MSDKSQEDWLLLRCKQARLAALKEVREMVCQYHANTINDAQRKQSEAILGNIDAMIAEE